MNKVNLSRFTTQNLFQIRACVISARKDLDVTTMFTYSHANTPLGQSERAYYLGYGEKYRRLMMQQGSFQMVINLHFFQYFFFNIVICFIEEKNNNINIHH